MHSERKRAIKNRNTYLDTLLLPVRGEGMLEILNANLEALRVGG